MKKLFLLSAISLFALTINADAASLPDQVKDDVSKNNFTGLQTLAKASPNATDEVVKTLLHLTKENLTINPKLSSQSIGFAAKFADQISPPSVPAICADLRQIVESMPGGETQSPLFASVVSASEAFAKAPVVVAAGRPKLCEEAWQEMDAQLAQQPGYVPPTIPPHHIKPSGE